MLTIDRPPAQALAELAARRRALQEKEIREMQAAVERVLGNWDEMHFLAQTRPVLDAFLLLAHLRPGEAERAAWCHKVLVTQLQRDLRELGFVSGWHDVARLVCTVLEAHDWWLDEGEWRFHPELAEKRAAAEGRRALINVDRVTRGPAGAPPNDGGSHQ